jgi:hypothetical protein
MNQDNTYLADRLRGAFEIEMSETTRTRQISAISTALKDRPTQVPATLPIGASLRRRFAAVVAAVTILTPVAAAVAAESSIPGDVLYPIKQVSEDVRSVFDPSIQARHRLDEASEMHQTGFPLVEVQRVLTDADNAIAEAGEPAELRIRLTAMMSAIGIDAMGDARTETRRDAVPLVPLTPPVSPRTQGTPGADQGEIHGTTPDHRDPSASRMPPGSRYQDMMADGDASDQDKATSDTSHDNTTVTGDTSDHDTMTGNTGTSNHESTPPKTAGDSSGSRDGNEDSSGTGHDGRNDGDAHGSWSP